MKNKKQSITIAALLVLLTTTVAANGHLKDINAQLNAAITIKYNGEEQTLRDASGTMLYPISYNGSTYVPVRAVSDIFGEDVKWDGATSTISLGSEVPGEKTPKNVVDTFTTGNKRLYKIIEASELKIEGSDATSTFKTGIAFKIEDGQSSFNKSHAVPMNVAGYDTLTFTVSCDLDSVALITDGEGNIITSFDVAAGSIVSKEINIAGYDSISFGANSQNNSNYGDGVMKFLDPIVK